ncbi:MAG: hypothetical protein AAGU27_13460 [Dehalobacterium sp.]
MIQQRRNRPRRVGAQPTVNGYSRIRRRKSRVRRNPQQVNTNSKPKTGQLESIMSWIKNANITNLSGQLHTIADHMATFGQVADVMKQFNGLGGGLNLGGGGGFNLMSLLKDNNIANLIQAFLPALGAAGLVNEEKSEPIKVDPIKVETHQK